MNNNFAPRALRRFLTAAAVVAVSTGTVLSAGVAQAAGFRRCGPTESS